MFWREGEREKRLILERKREKEPEQISQDMKINYMIDTEQMFTFRIRLG